MLIRIQATPNQSAGEGHLPPSFEGVGLGSWAYPALVAPDAPLGGGHDATGWYRVREVEVPSFGWLVRAYASCIWHSQSGREQEPDLPADHEEQIAAQALNDLGYRPGPYSPGPVLCNCCGLRRWGSEAVGLADSSGHVWHYDLCRDCAAGCTTDEEGQPAHLGPPGA